MSTPELTPVAARQRALVQASQFNSWEWLFRLSIVVALLGSAFLIWWSVVKVLIPRQQQSRDLNSRVSHLSSEVDDLQLKWAKADPGRVSQRYGEVQSGLLTGDMALDNWKTEMQEQATALGLEVKAEFGKTTLPATNNPTLAVIPTILTVDVLHPFIGGQTLETPYQRILLFSQRLSTQEKRADLTELTVSGGTNSIQHAVFVLNLWASAEEPE